MAQTPSNPSKGSLLKQIAVKLARLPRGTQALVSGLAALVVILWPRKTTKLDYISGTTRDLYYGPIRFVPAPTEDNAEGVRLTNDFESKNIIRKTFPLIGFAAIHRLAAPSLEAALREIERKGMGHLVRSYAGGFYPRFVRGSKTNLSSHSYGTSIDINAQENPQGHPPTPGQEQLAPIFEKHGWYWGDKFRPTRDPMHFEFILPPKGVLV